MTRSMSPNAFGRMRGIDRRFFGRFIAYVVARGFRRQINGKILTVRRVISTLVPYALVALYLQAFCPLTVSNNGRLPFFVLLLRTRHAVCPRCVATAKDREGNLFRRPFPECKNGLVHGTLAVVLSCNERRLIGIWPFAANFWCFGRNFQGGALSYDRIRFPPSSLYQDAGPI